MGLTLLIVRAGFCRSNGRMAFDAAHRVAAKTRSPVGFENCRSPIETMPRRYARLIPFASAPGILQCDRGGGDAAVRPPRPVPASLTKRKVWFFACRRR